MSTSLPIRCDGTLYGHLTDSRWLEVKCKRRRCGYVKGTVVLHTIDLHTGKVVSTKRFSEPQNRKESPNVDSHDTSAAVRAS